jgi:serine/threonine protein kinase
MLAPGTVVADRFEIEALAEAGGMGAVYRARDRLSGGTVAVKVLLTAGLRDDPRFSHEAKVLAEVKHSSIVRYVAHGRARSGEQYLAMEWLEGEDLSARLARAGLTLGEGLSLARRVAEGLAVMHERGIVHRDLKPSNLFLSEGRIDRVKVLDFGLAYRVARSRVITRTGTAVGTPGYMAPEQARGEKDVDARADVFALGCVLFECLTGKPAFFADHPMGILAKILFEDAPRVRSLRADVPEIVDELVASLLGKDRAERPADGRAVASLLDAIGPLGDEALAPSVSATQSLTRHEQRLVGMVLAARRDSTGTTAETEVILASAAPTITVLDLDLPDLATLRSVAEPHGARLEVLADGSIAAMLSGAGAATDLAARAASCALSLRAVLPGSPLAIATGRGELSQRLPVSEVIDRGVRLLRVAASVPRATSAEGPIRVDDVTAGLLGARFDLAGDDRGLELLAERARGGATRKLLGKPTPCVGRDRELRLLDDVLDQVVSESVARAVLVTAPAGAGKSRLRHEWLEAIDRGDAPPGVLIALGDAMRAGSAFGLAAQLVREAAQIRAGEPLAVRQQKLRARVGRNVPEGRAAAVAEFLGELAGAPFPDSAQLRAARQDPIVMGEQIRCAWEDWLAAQCADGPLVLVLEDVHWGDLPSVKLIDSALRRLEDRPLMVLALGRPDVLDLFPRLWAERNIQEIRLGGLTRKAGEKLIREVLGAEVDPATSSRILDTAGGNAFFLEELIRAVAEGKGQSFPETVVAMAQARLESMDAEARQILRAAAVFGRVFWLGGVAALIGARTGAADLRARVDDLVERELVEPQASRFRGEAEHLFRHALVREAAYAMLTDADRALGHRLAGEWLERKGEADALVLAEHFELGGERERAAAGYLRAAEQALEGSDLDAVGERAARAVACGASGEVLGALRLIAGEVHVWRGQPALAEVATSDAMRLLPKGNARWCRAAGGNLLVNVQLGNPGKLLAVVADLSALEPDDDARGSYLWAASIAVSFFVNLALYDMMARFLERIEAVAGSAASVDSQALGWVELARMHWASFVEGDMAAQLRLASAAVREFERAGDLRSLSFARTQVGYGHLLLGDLRAAEPWIVDGAEGAARLKATYIALRARVYHAEVMLRDGRVDEAIATARAVAAAFNAASLRNMEGLTRRLLARALVAAGELDEAEREARTAADMLMLGAYHWPEALTVLAEVLLAQGRAADARSAAEQAMTQIAALGRIGIGDTSIRLIHAEALFADGDRDAARAAIEAARDRLHEKAAKIDDDAARARFLGEVAENARTIALAEAWGAGEAAR